MSESKPYFDWLSLPPADKDVDIACVEQDINGLWTAHYKIFVEWGSRVVVCDGQVCRFKTAGDAVEWVHTTFEAVTIVSSKEFFNVERGKDRYQ